MTIVRTAVALALLSPAAIGTAAAAIGTAAPAGEEASTARVAALVDARRPGEARAMAEGPLADLRKRERPLHPYLWTGFVVAGAPD